MGKLLRDLTKEELEIICREQSCDICVLVETKKKVLENNRKLADMYKRECLKNQQAADTIFRLQAENANLIMLCRKHGLI